MVPDNLTDLAKTVVAYALIGAIFVAASELAKRLQ